MKLAACGILFSFLVVVLYVDLTTAKASSEELAKYRCPFSMFNAGHPALYDNGEIMFCGKGDVQCPHYHFCAAGYEDGRDVCCHILGP